MSEGSSEAVLFLPYWQPLVLNATTSSLASNVYVHAPLLLSGVIAAHREPEELFSVANEGVGVYDGDVKSAFQSGTLALTSHRILYFFSHPSLRRDAPVAFFLSLSQILGGSLVVSKGFGSWSHPKIAVDVLPNPSQPVVRSSPHNTQRVYKFSFRSGGCEEFSAALHQCIQRRLWQRHAPTPPPKALELTRADRSANETPAAAERLGVTATSPSVSSSSLAATSDLLSFTDRAGIGGLQRTQNMDSSSADAMAMTALTDVESVLTNATALVQDIRKLRVQLACEPSDASPSAAASSCSATGLREEDLQKLLSVEEALGIAGSAVKRSNASMTSEQLAYEMLAWVSHPANAAILTQRYLLPLTEFYALYNTKARGRSAKLITPSEFLDAIREFEKILSGSRIRGQRSGLGDFTVRCFACGAKALQCTRDFSALMVRYLGPRPTTWKALLADGGASSIRGCALGVRSIDASALAQSLQVHVTVAQELLEDLEVDEVLCRDESGTAFAKVCSFSWNVFLLAA